ncbi:hypothetical protein LUX39_00635 [Actinomadura madurae]|nr:hypothetical protein [Actinomadura madurae]
MKDHSSAAAWWRRRTSDQSSSPVRTRVPRTGRSVPMSKMWEAASFSMAARRSGVSARASTTARRARTSGPWTLWTGSPSGPSTSRVRSASWRATTSPKARSSASASTGPCRRSPSGRA